MADDERSEIAVVRAKTGYTGPILGAGAALHDAERHGDMSGIVLRRDLGLRLTPEELDAIERLERGAPMKRGPRDPATNAAEAVVCCRWLVERCEESPTNARSLLAEMMGTTPQAILSRIKRSEGLARNIADLAYDRHVQTGAVPALLLHRTPDGRCMSCRKTKCRCDLSPRTVFEETDGGRVVAMLLGFHRSRFG